MAQTFEIDQDTLVAIEELRRAFGVKTYVGVIRKALALARVCSEYLDEKGNLTMLNKTGEPFTVLMRN